MFHAPSLPRTLEAALRDLGSKKENVRVEAARDLARHGQPDAPEEQRARVVKALESALRDAAGRVRAAAAIALADADGREALPSLLVAVEDDDGQVRQMAITALGEIGDPRATERLRRALSDARPEVRFQAAMAFPRVCSSRADAIESLVRATEDEDPLVCQIALRMAEEVGHADGDVVPEGVLERARALCDHAEPIVRVAAAIVTARAGDTTGHDVLEAVGAGSLKTSEGEDEAAAIELCGELSLQGAREGLEKRAFGGLLGSRDRFKWHARVALARMGHTRAQKQILAELESWDRGTRTLAVAAAGKARMESARTALLGMRGSPERIDPDTLEDALAALEPRKGTDGA